MKRIFLALSIMILAASYLYGASWTVQGITEDSSIDGTEKVPLENATGDGNNWAPLSSVKAWISTSPTFLGDVSFSSATSVTIGYPSYPVADWSPDATKNFGFDSTVTGLSGGAFARWNATETGIAYFLEFMTLPTTTGQYPSYNATTDLWEWATPPLVDAIEYVIDGGGSAITTGVKGFLEIPYGATIVQVTTFCDQSGSIVVDIWKDTYANYPPTVADTITASAKPTLSTAIKTQDATLTGWTTSITSGDIIGFNVDSAATVERCTVSLKVSK